MPVWLGILIFCVGMFLIFLLSKLSQYLYRKSRREEGQKQQSQVSDEDNLRISGELLDYKDKKLSTFEKKFRERVWQITEKEGEAINGKLFVTKEIIDRAFAEIIEEQSESP